MEMILSWTESHNDEMPLIDNIQARNNKGVVGEQPQVDEEGNNPNIGSRGGFSYDVERN